MKRILILICIFAFCCSGCKKDNSKIPDAPKQIIVFPSEQTAATLNGYKQSVSEDTTQNKMEYVGNSNSKKFHLSDCTYAKNIKAENVVKSFNRTEMINGGYAPCKRCKP